MPSFDNVEDLIPRAEIFRSKLIEDFQLLDSISKASAEVPKYYSSELSGMLRLKSFQGEGCIMGHFLTVSCHNTRFLHCSTTLFFSVPKPFDQLLL